MREFHILNLGAGVQSTTLYLMSIEGLVPKVPKFDHAVFADTQEEPRAVYDHMLWLKSLDGPPIETCTAGRLGQDLVTGKNSRGADHIGKNGGRFAAIPTFTSADQGVTVGRTKRQCSKEYKLEPIDKFIRRQVLGVAPRHRLPKDVTVHQYFGISIDEAGRAGRIWERFHLEKSTQWVPHFPLIDIQFSRANCLEWLKNRVPHQVPRSACVFCPFHDDAEWQRLKDGDPADWDRAVEIDVALRTVGSVANRSMNQDMFLHRSCQPLTQITFRPRSNPKEMQLGFGVECDGVCGV